MPQKGGGGGGGGLRQRGDSWFFSSEQLCFVVSGLRVPLLVRHRRQHFRATCCINVALGDANCFFVFLKDDVVFLFSNMKMCYTCV